MARVTSLTTVAWSAVNRHGVNCDNACRPVHSFSGDTRLTRGHVYLVVVCRVQYP